VALRFRDLDSRARTVTVRIGKGANDRTTVLPATLTLTLQQHLFHVVALYKRNFRRAAGYGHRSLQTTMIYTHID
jgi:site-specific recombinase XerD